MKTKTTVKQWHITLPMSDDELVRLKDVKRSGIALWRWVRDAIIEKLNREEGI